MIEERCIRENLSAFSFPRLSGTEFEKKSFSLAKQKIEDLNLTPSVQKFSFSTFYSRIYPKFGLILLFWLHFTLFFNIYWVFRLLSLILTLIMLLVLTFITRNPEKIQFGKTLDSQNLYIKLPSKSINSDKNILLFSHLDSKGQILSIKFRIQSYFIWIFSFIFGILIITVNSFLFVGSFLWLFIIGAIMLGINFISTIIITINSTNNKSKGAIDNASGVSCVLELLRYYSSPEFRLDNLNLWFVFTGAEESGTMGVRNFYNNIKYFDRDKTFTINFDSIAKKVNLWDHGLLNNKNYKSFNYILENKGIMSLEKKTHRFYIGTYSDGLFLLNKRFKGLGNGDKSTYNYIHSEKDDLDKIDITVLKKLCQFYTILLNEIDINLNK
ncbi:MAG: M28 family metallopeptidase [Promethearchaeota archaeon]